MAIVNFFGRMYTEDNGKPSFSRFNLTVVILFTMFWVTVIVFTKGVLPDLTSAGVFLGIVGSVTYGLKLAQQTTESVTSKKMNGNGNGGGELKASVMSEGPSTTEVTSK